MKIENIKYKKIAIDSRSVSDGDVFIGIKGPNHNGSDFARQAIDNGAAICILDHIPNDCLSHTDKIIIVEDTYKDGLMVLANRIRGEMNDSNIIGITGSIGKTTTKEMLKLALSGISDSVYANIGNQNNHYGLPLAIANTQPLPLEYGIFEMGMSAKGEIDYLSKILKPNIGIITGIAPVHLEFFNSVNDIAHAKAELIPSISDGGAIIINIDTGYTDILLSYAKNLRIYKYTTTDNTTADVRIIKNEIIKKDGVLNSYITAEYKTNNKSQTISYILPDITQAILSSSAAVISTLISLNENIEKGMMGLEKFSTPAGRGKKHLLKNGIILIDDAYNSSPVSLEAGINSLQTYASHCDIKRKIIIIGDMLELGVNELDIHKNISKIIEKCQLDKVFCIGNRMKSLFDILPSAKKGLWAENSTEMSEKIISLLQPHDIILIKGSAGMKMGVIKDKIISLINFTTYTSC